MNKSEQKRFGELYHKHLHALKLQGMSDKTIEAYSRALQQISAWFDCCPDRLAAEQLAGYFAELVQSHSWSTFKLYRCGLQFFYKHVLNRDWGRVEMIRAPKIRSIPDIPSVEKIERLIGAARKLRYRVQVLATYSTGHGLGETLALQVGDIDSGRKQVHIRSGKGHKDRLVTYRYGRGSILITTNKSVRDWSELLAGDEVLTAAILDRLLHNAHVINIKGRSYRLRDLEQTLGARTN